MKWVELCVAILSGLVVCIPLVAELVSQIRASIMERNWANLLRIVMKYMCEAEQTFDSGLQKKAFVMAQLDAAAASVNYDLTDEARQKISDMIDAMCSMAKTVNA